MKRLQPILRKRAKPKRLKKPLKARHQRSLKLHQIIQNIWIWLSVPSELSKKEMDLLVRRSTSITPFYISIFITKTFFFLFLKLFFFFYYKNFFVFITKTFFLSQKLFVFVFVFIILFIKKTILLFILN